MKPVMIGSDARELQQQHPEYFEQVRGCYRRNFILLVADTSTFAFVLSLLSQDTIMPYFVDQLSDRSWLVGLVPALFYLGLFLPQLIGAYLVNGRRTRKWLILTIALTERGGVLIIALVAQFLGVLTPAVTLALFFLAFLLFSVTNGLIIPGYADFISKSIVYNRGLFFGVLNGVSGLMGFGASLLAQRWLDGLSFPENVRLIFWIAMLVSALSPIFLINIKEIPYPVERRAEPLGDFFRAIPGHVRARPGFRRFLLARAALSFGIMGNAFYALYAIERFDLSPGVLGVFMMVILLTQSLAGFIWGWVGDRFGYRSIYILGSALVVLMGGLALLASAAWVFYLVAFGIGGIYAIFRVADANMVFNLAPPAETSRFIGITNTFIAPVMTLSPLIGGILVDVFGHAALFGVITVIGLLSTALSVAIMPRRRRSSE